jgi:hypothetical protein
MERDDYQYNSCIVRPVSRSIVNALRLEEPETPIQFEVAKKQHQNYTLVLKKLIPKVFEVFNVIVFRLLMRFFVWLYLWLVIRAAARGTGTA